MKKKKKNQLEALLMLCSYALQKVVKGFLLSEVKDILSGL